MYLERETTSACDQFRSPCMMHAAIACVYLKVVCDWGHLLPAPRHHFGPVDQGALDSYETTYRAIVPNRRLGYE